MNNLKKKDIIINYILYKIARKKNNECIIITHFNCNYLCNYNDYFEENSNDRELDFNSRDLVCNR